MNKLKVLCLVLFIVIISHAGSAAPRIILKFDDLAWKYLPSCRKVFEYCIQNDVRASWGVMRLEGISEENKKVIRDYFNLKDRQGRPLFEMWHHGLDHTKDNPLGTKEFKGTSYLYQKEHFDQGNDMVKSVLGIQMHTFGAPYNAVDSSTIKVISQNSAYKVLFFSNINPDLSTGIINLNQRVNMESATGVVSYSTFLEQYNANKSKYKEVMILQGHPFMWTEAMMNDFDKIVRFLRAEECEFVLPYEYVTTISKK